MSASGGVGSDDEIAAVEGNGAAGIDSVTAGTRQPIIPFGSVERESVKFVSPNKVITDGRSGFREGGEKATEKENREEPPGRCRPPL
jgi:hypothetical protein